MGYVERLRDFNSTEKYRDEMEFMFSIMGLEGMGCTVLDYGCGLGTMVRELIQRGYTTYGYDVVWYEDSEPEPWWIRSTENEFDHCYMMHSIAHIEKVGEALQRLRKFCGDVTVITPNLEWLELKGQSGYTPDPTVKQHFTSEALERLFVDAGFKIQIQGQFGNLLMSQHERLFLKAR